MPLLPRNARLNAALAIAGTEAREAALRQLALDSTASHNGKLTKEVLEHITAVERKDTTAQMCALDLARQGDVAGAQSVAQLISSEERRDRTLAMIAQTQGRPTPER
jgi:hypothetical protein